MIGFGAVPYAPLPLKWPQPVFPLAWLQVTAGTASLKHFFAKAAACSANSTAHAQHVVASLAAEVASRCWGKNTGQSWGWEGQHATDTFDWEC